MKILSNRVVVAVLAFLLGGTGALAVQKYINDKKVVKPHHTDDFFGWSHNPFREIERMQSRMTKQFDNDGFFHNPLSQLDDMNFNVLSNDGIKKHEDKKYVYYDIETKGEPPQDLKVQIKNKQLDITGRYEKQNNSKTSQAYYSSLFERSLPLPDGVDASKFQMKRLGNAIELIFPKTKAYLST